MRAVAWGCVVAGALLAVAAFVITANTPTVNPCRRGPKKTVTDSDARLWDPWVRVTR